MRLIPALLVAAALPAATFVALDLAVPRAAAAEVEVDAHSLYQSHCQSCHGENRRGRRRPGAPARDA